MHVKRLERCALEQLPFPARMLINIFALKELITDAYSATNEDFCPLLKRQMIDRHETNMRRTELPKDVSNDTLELYEQLRSVFTPEQLISTCKTMNAKYDYAKNVCEASGTHCAMCTCWYKRHVTYWLSFFLLYASTAVAPYF
jgi:hypothetical protein